MVVDDHEEIPIAAHMRVREGADDIHVDGVATVRGRVELAAVGEARSVGGYAVVAVGMARPSDGGGGIGGVADEAPHALGADVEAVVHDGGGSVGG